MLSRRPSPAMVMAVIALLVALSGSGYAAVKLNGKNLTNRSVAATKLKKNAITATEVKNGSLGSSDFKLGQLPAGPAGPAGARGPQGSAGPAGTALAFARVDAASSSPTVLVDPAHAKNITAANVTRISAGRYCFHGLAFTPKSIMAMPDTSGFSDSLAKGTVRTTADCDVPPNQAIVEIYRPVSEPGSCCFEDVFYVWFQ